jgi:serine/threonine protein phosphatase PrpC
LEDGYSTGGTAGTGLGAIKRISSYFDVHTAIGAGSAVVARLQRKSHASSSTRFHFAIGAISSSHPAETICGDAWAASERDHDLTIIVADGLGHGPLAASAAQAAIHIFEEFRGEPPEEIVNRANDALRSTRGAAVAIAKIDTRANEVIYAGMGNIAATIHRQGTMKSLVSSNGTVGASTRKAQSFTYPWSADSTLVMVSDGLSSHLRVDRHPGLLRRDPTMIAGVLYRDFKRGKDDATIVVARQAEVADQ